MNPSTGKEMEQEDDAAMSSLGPMIGGMTLAAREADAILQSFHIPDLPEPADPIPETEAEQRRQFLNPVALHPLAFYTPPTPRPRMLTIPHHRSPMIIRPEPAPPVNEEPSIEHHFTPDIEAELLRREAVMFARIAAEKEAEKAAADARVAEWEGIKEARRKKEEEDQVVIRRNAELIAAREARNAGLEAERRRNAVSWMTGMGRRRAGGGKKEVKMYRPVIGVQGFDGGGILGDGREPIVVLGSPRPVPLEELSDEIEEIKGSEEEDESDVDEVPRVADSRRSSSIAQPELRAPTNDQHQQGLNIRPAAEGRDPTEVLEADGEEDDQLPRVQVRDRKRRRSGHAGSGFQPASMGPPALTNPLLRLPAHPARALAAAAPPASQHPHNSAPPTTSSSLPRRITTKKKKIPGLQIDRFGDDYLVEYEAGFTAESVIGQWNRELCGRSEKYDGTDDSEPEGDARIIEKILAGRKRCGIHEYVVKYEGWGANGKKWYARNLLGNSEEWRQYASRETAMDPRKR